MDKVDNKIEDKENVESLDTAKVEIPKPNMNNIDLNSDNDDDDDFFDDFFDN